MYLTNRQAIWDIARKFNDYFPRQYKVHFTDYMPTEASVFVSEAFSSVVDRGIHYQQVFFPLTPFKYLR